MSEPTTQTPPAPPVQDFVYRPLSGVAVAGVVVASLFAGLLAIFMVTAVWRGETFILPLWMLLLPAAGVGMSLLGRWHILRSEGTRAGLGLTRWGTWIGLIAGLGYGTYYFFTGLAVTNQAHHFLVEKGQDAGYLARLQAGDVNGAFLLTRPLSERSGANPNDQEAMDIQFDLPAPGDKEMRGLLTMFALDPVVRRLTAPGADVKIEPLGVKSWSYENKGYKVERLYKITTREGEFEILLTAQSMDSSLPGEGRKWFVFWQPKQGAPPMVLTPTGKKFQALRRQSADFANDWLAKIFQFELASVYLYTQPVQQRAPLVQKAVRAQAEQVLAFLPLQPLAGPLAVSAVAAPATLTATPERLWPGFADLMDGAGCLHTETLKATPADRNLVRKQLQGYARTPFQGQFPAQLHPGEAALAPVEEASGGSVKVTQRLAFPMMIQVSGQPRRFFVVEAEIVLANAAPDPNNQQARQNWQIVRVDFIRAQALQASEKQPSPLGP